MSAETGKKRARAWDDLLFSSAGEVARTGDRFFVAVAHDVADAGRWARREADIIGESMSAALQTTMEVARKMKPGAEASPPVAPPEQEPTPAADPARPSNIDVLTALNQVGIPRQASESELMSHHAGIAPLLTALKEVVSSRGEGGYAALQSDERFWALVELIHEHGEKSQASADGAPVKESEGSE